MFNFFENDVMTRNVSNVYLEKDSVSKCMMRVAWPRGAGAQAGAALQADKRRTCITLHH